MSLHKPRWVLPARVGGCYAIQCPQCSDSARPTITCLVVLLPMPRGSVNQTSPRFGCDVVSTNDQPADAIEDRVPVGTTIKLGPTDGAQAVELDPKLALQRFDEVPPHHQALVGPGGGIVTLQPQVSALREFTPALGLPPVVEGVAACFST